MKTIEMVIDGNTVEIGLSSIDLNNLALSVGYAKKLAKKKYNVAIQEAEQTFKKEVEQNINEYINLFTEHKSNILTGYDVTSMFDNQQRNGGKSIIDNSGGLNLATYEFAGQTLGYYILQNCKDLVFYKNVFKINDKGKVESLEINKDIVNNPNKCTALKVIDMNIFNYSNTYLPILTFIEEFKGYVNEIKPNTPNASQ